MQQGNYTLHSYIFIQLTGVHRKNLEGGLQSPRSTLTGFKSPQVLAQQSEASDVRGRCEEQLLGPSAGAVSAQDAGGRRRAGPGPARPGTSPGSDTSRPCTHAHARTTINRPFAGSCRESSSSRGIASLKTTQHDAIKPRRLAAQQQRRDAVPRDFQLTRTTGPGPSELSHALSLGAHHYQHHQQPAASLCLTPPSTTSALMAQPWPDVSTCCIFPAANIK